MDDANTVMAARQWPSPILKYQDMFTWKAVGVIAIQRHLPFLPGAGSARKLPLFTRGRLTKLLMARIGGDDIVPFPRCFRRRRQMPSSTQAEITSAARRRRRLDCERRQERFDWKPPPRSKTCVAPWKKRRTSRRKRQIVGSTFCSVPPRQLRLRPKAGRGARRRPRRTAYLPHRLWHYG